MKLFLSFDCTVRQSLLSRRPPTIRSFLGAAINSHTISVSEECAPLHCPFHRRQLPVCACRLPMLCAVMSCAAHLLWWRGELSVSPGEEKPLQLNVVVQWANESDLHSPQNIPREPIFTADACLSLPDNC